MVRRCIWNFPNVFWIEQYHSTSAVCCHIVFQKRITPCFRYSFSWVQLQSPTHCLQRTTSKGIYLSSDIVSVSSQWILKLNCSPFVFCSIPPSVLWICVCVSADFPLTSNCRFLIACAGVPASSRVFSSQPSTVWDIIPRRQIYIHS